MLKKIKYCEKVYAAGLYDEFYHGGDARVN